MNMGAAAEEEELTGPSEGSTAAANTTGVKDVTSVYVQKEHL